MQLLSVRPAGALIAGPSPGDGVRTRCSKTSVHMAGWLLWRLMVFLAFFPPLFFSPSISFSRGDTMTSRRLANMSDRNCSQKQIFNWLNSCCKIHISIGVKCHYSHSDWMYRGPMPVEGKQECMYSHGFGNWWLVRIIIRELNYTRALILINIK